MFTEVTELEGGPVSQGFLRLPWRPSPYPGLSPRREVRHPVGSCPASPGTALCPSQPVGQQGQATPGAQTAKGNLIKQETGLQPDKAPRQHLEPLFPLFLRQTFPGTHSRAWGAPGPRRGSHRDLILLRQGVARPVTLRAVSWCQQQQPQHPPSELLAGAGVISCNPHSELVRHVPSPSPFYRLGNGGPWR